MRYNWKELNRLQLGALGEYFGKLELALEREAEIDRAGL
jgi:hypothetical protein